LPNDKGDVPMRVEFHYSTSETGGGMRGGTITFTTEDPNNLPRLPEIGEKIQIVSGPKSELYTVEKIEWRIDIPRAFHFGYRTHDELTMIVQCRAHASSPSSSKPRRLK